MSDFLIVGAGINGLLLARELLAAGASVRLVERSQVGKEASWAGGGIVSPLYPWRYGAAVTALADWAQEFYPGLAAALGEETGLDVEFNPCGLLMLDAEDEDGALQWARRRDRSMETVSAAAIYKQEPALASGFGRGLWMQNIANVRNPLLLQALQASLRQSAKFSVLQHSEVVAMRRFRNRVTAVEVKTNDSSSVDRYVADEIVITAGAWSSHLLHFAEENIPVAPVKGQMLLYRFNQPPISAIVLHRGRYLIPRRDGHLLVGSTLEHVGFDKTATDDARTILAESAGTLLPQLRSMEPVAQWAGLRPGSPGGVPVIGRLPSLENVAISSGHFRNGLVLAPASARLLADILLQRQPILDPAPYQPASNAGVGETNKNPTDDQGSRAESVEGINNR